MSSKGIYKSGQGYWVRLMSAIGYGVIVALGLIWLWKQVETIDFGDRGDLCPGHCDPGRWPPSSDSWGTGSSEPSTDQSTFMIATEGEMKKVNWSSKTELTRSTLAVIGLTHLVALLCWVELLSSVDRAEHNSGVVGVLQT